MNTCTPHRRWTRALLAAGALLSAAAATSAIAQDADAPAPAPAPPGVLEIGMEEPPVKFGNTIRLTTYNILNLFDEVDDPALSGDQDDMHDDRLGLRAKPESQLKAVADTIRRLDTDILALQEIESEAALRWFRDEYLVDLGYEHLVSLDAGDGRGIEQAVLSRFPLLDAKIWPDLELGGVHPEKYGEEENWLAGQPLKMRRSPLRVTVRIPATTPGARDVDITLFVVHHKSGRHAGYWREAEANGVVRLINQHLREHPGRPVIVLGDFNALPTDASMMNYYKSAIRDVHLKIRDTITAEQMTHESRRTIDFILVNDAMLTYVARRPPFVLATPIRPRGVDWRGPAPEGYASDHMPLSIDLYTRNRGRLTIPEGYNP